MRKEEVLRMIDAIHRDRGVDREILFTALEEALTMATRKRMGVEEGFDVRIDRRNGQISLEMPNGEVAFPSAEELGRIAAQTTKQVFMQKIREAERDKTYGQFETQIGSVVAAVVHKIEGPNIILLLNGKNEALLPRSERVLSERLHVGDRLRVLVKEVRKEGPRVVIIASRRDERFVQKLFEVEIPEIQEGLVRVMRVARDAGYRSKVAVYSMDPRVDAIGSCLGVRGTRIRNINDELGQEKIDIIGWSDSLEELVQNALKPAKDISLDHIFPDEDSMSVFVLVSDDQKPLAIGVGGRNVRLASRIVGWEIEIKTPAEYEAELLAEGQYIEEDGPPVEGAPAPEDEAADQAAMEAPPAVEASLDESSMDSEASPEVNPESEPKVGSPEEN